MWWCGCGCVYVACVWVLVCVYGVFVYECVFGYGCGCVYVVCVWVCVGVDGWLWVCVVYVVCGWV